MNVTRILNVAEVECEAQARGSRNLEVSSEKNKKRAPRCLGYIRDEILPSDFGDYNIPL